MDSSLVLMGINCSFNMSPNCCKLSLGRLSAGESFLAFVSDNSWRPSLISPSETRSAANLSFFFSGLNFSRTSANCFNFALSCSRSASHADECLRDCGTLLAGFPSSDPALSSFRKPLFQSFFKSVFQPKWTPKVTIKRHEREPKLAWLVLKPVRNNPDNII